MEHNVMTKVSAPPEALYRLFVDVERWPQMTKSIREVRLLDSGPLQVGSEAIVKQPGMAPLRWRVTELVPGTSFTWETTSLGVTAVGGHVVMPDPSGSVITLSLRQHGPLARLVSALTGRLTHRYLSMELDGFRRAAEAEAGAEAEGEAGQA
jgi:uncharacterized membrane protein